MKIPGVVEGKSLLPIIQGRQAIVRDWLLCGYKDSQRMVRDERWKLIEYNAAGTRNTQLFDLKKDPDEIQNLALEPKYRPQLERLQQLMIAGRHYFGDPVR